MINRKVVILLLISLGMVSSNECVWKNPQGITYDLNPLSKSQGWQVKEDLTGQGVFNMVYMFNFCGSQQGNCNGMPAQVYEALEVYGDVTTNCDTIAKMGPYFSNIDNDVKKGLQVVYNGGDLCYSQDQMMPQGNDDISVPQEQMQQQRQAIFLFECSKHNDNSFTVDANDPCKTIFKMKSQVGCKEGLHSGHSNFKTLFILMLLFSGYLVGGYFINKKQKGLDGIEALPHLEFWQDFPNIVLEGVRFSLDKGMKMSKKISYKIKSIQSGNSNDNEGYQTV